MPPGALALVLTAAVAHAAWNLASKCKRGDTLSFVAAYTIASAILFLPLGIGLAVTGPQPVTWPLAGASAASAILHLVYSLTLQAGYDRAQLSVVYPVARGTGPLLTMGFAVLLLNEQITWIAGLGVFAVIAGILIVTGRPARRASERPARGVVWGVATGATIASYTLWDAHAIADLELAPVSYYAGTLLAQCLLLAPSVVRRTNELAATLRVDWRPIVVVAVLSPLAYTLVLTAMQTAPVALVAPLREASIVIGSLAAWRLFHEHGLARRLTGALAVLAGVAAVSL